MTKNELQRLGYSRKGAVAFAKAYGRDAEPEIAKAEKGKIMQEIALRRDKAARKSTGSAG